MLVREIISDLEEAGYETPQDVVLDAPTQLYWNPDFAVPTHNPLSEEGHPHDLFVPVRATLTPLDMLEASSLTYHMGDEAFFEAARGMLDAIVVSRISSGSDRALRLLESNITEAYNEAGIDATRYSPELRWAFEFLKHNRLHELGFFTRSHQDAVVSISFPRTHTNRPWYEKLATKKWSDVVFVGREKIIEAITNHITGGIKPHPLNKLQAAMDVHPFEQWWVGYITLLQARRGNLIEHKPEIRRHIAASLVSRIFQTPELLASLQNTTDLCPFIIGKSHSLEHGDLILKAHRGFTVWTDGRTLL